jgi:hypothetical protein
VRTFAALQLAYACKLDLQSGGFDFQAVKPCLIVFDHLPADLALGEQGVDAAAQAPDAAAVLQALPRTGVRGDGKLDLHLE